MGALSFFEAELPNWVSKNNSQLCDVELIDEHGVPELRVHPLDNSHDGYKIRFEDWSKFIEFYKAVTDLYSRLENVKDEGFNES